MNEIFETDLEKINGLDCAKNILYFNSAKISWIDYREVIVMVDNVAAAKRVEKSLTETLVDDNSFLAIAAIIDGFQNLFGGFSLGENLIQKYDCHSLTLSAKAAVQAYSRVFSSDPGSATERFQGYARDAALLFAFHRTFFAKTTATPIIH
ncbi:MAG: hypothetical protein LBO66_05360 [Deltaproteobacteria bacterium]|jgi:hypothetical protein|nr:hypothetical protein [Deltaproteobacteria bacterium]